jgi:hypothetical protein
MDQRDLPPGTETNLDLLVIGNTVLVEDHFDLQLGVLLVLQVVLHTKVRILVTCLQLENVILAPIANTVMINLLLLLLPLLKGRSVRPIALHPTQSD